MNISFDNTENAFAYKSDHELKSAKFLFSTMGYPWFVQIGTRLTPFVMKTGLPVHGIIRKTIFKQFVGGETLVETAQVGEILGKYGIKVILDYGVEGKEGEENFDRATDEFIRVIEYAATQTNTPFISIKITGLARFSLLQRLNEAPRLRSGIHDNEEENAEWDRVRDRMYSICEIAAEKGIGVLIDAEESWIQDPIDRLTMEVMEEFNKEKVVVYNTIQLYRHDRLSGILSDYLYRKSTYHQSGCFLHPAVGLIFFADRYRNRFENIFSFVEKNESFSAVVLIKFGDSCQTIERLFAAALILF